MQVADKPINRFWVRNRRLHIMPMLLFLGICLWLADAYLDYRLVATLSHQSFWNSLFRPEPHDLAARFMVVLGFIVFGLLTKRLEVRRRQSTFQLEWESTTNAALAALAQALLHPNSLKEMAQIVLENATRLTGSGRGFVGFLDQASGSFLGIFAERSPGEEEGEGVRKTVFSLARELWGVPLPIMTAQILVAPNAQLKFFLGAPARIGETLVGAVAIADPDEPFATEDLVLIERIAALFAIAIQKHLAEEALHTAHAELEYRVKLRTAELDQMNQQLHREIAERNRAEVGLRSSEEKHRLLLESLQEGVWVVDRRTRTLYVNPYMAGMLGYSVQEMLGTDALSYSDDVARQTWIGKRRQALRGERTEAEIGYYRKDGSFLSAWVVVAPIFTERGRLSGVVAAVTDITERKKAEERIAASLREKEILLREIHHRVKNNLQIVSSLLDLQSESLKDPGDQEAFRDSQARVRSMALVHETLYQSDDLTYIDVSSYVNSLAHYLCGAYSNQLGPINLHLDIAHIPLNLDTAVPCGLVINELVTNALKHAFPKGQGGEIFIIFQKAGEEAYRLEVRDNGVGLPVDVDLQNPPTLGLRLVTLLARQLRGVLETFVEGGTTFRITFAGVRPYKGESL